MAAITLPGLIDPHVHLRTPGQSHKEDFYTGTSAALAGGYTTIIDMPNNKIPITTLERLEEKKATAKKQTVCDIGFHFGSLGDNLAEFSAKGRSSSGRKTVEDLAIGLKLYLNETTGNFLIDKQTLAKIFNAWNGGPILLHAEDDAVSEVINLVEKTKKPAHFCHISTAKDLQQIIAAKEKNLPISCGVTPHHLFLTEHDTEVLGPYGRMKPPLRKQSDVAFLWKHIDAIDIVESDHAPHTKEEKEGVMSMAGDASKGLPRSASAFASPPRRTRLAGEPWEKRAAGPAETKKSQQDRPAIPFGVPGLETTLPLLLTAVSEKRLTMADVIRLCHTGPTQCFHVSIHHNTVVKVDLNQAYTIENKNLHTKCGWSPFAGWKVKGKVTKVFMRGKKVFENGQILAKPGSGCILSHKI